ncbi:kinase domain-containing protein [Bisporella sp. PMI_857]|nr:kinase domain-containing protein [Bisporella sp. PMI_857]
MTGLGRTYEYLCEVIPILTRNSSLPTNATDLNPIIKQFFTTYPGFSISGVKGYSVLLSITDDIVAKVFLKSGNWHVSYKQFIFELLDRTLSPYIVQISFRCPDITFMEHFKNRTLYERISIINMSHFILQWMQQLSEAAACLELHGHVHSDINLRNILFNKYQLKLVDFDHFFKIENNLNVGYELYVRSRKKKTKSVNFNYGVAGPSTKQFALKLIFWFITRNTEFYYKLKKLEQVNHLMNCQFPATSPQNPINNIISDC